MATVATLVLPAFRKVAFRPNVNVRAALIGSLMKPTIRKSTRVQRAGFCGLLHKRMRRILFWLWRPMRHDENSGNESAVLHDRRKANLLQAVGGASR